MADVRALPPTNIFAQVAELIDRNGPRIAQEWLAALEQSGNRLATGPRRREVWRDALSWLALFLEALRSQDFSTHLATFRLTAQRLVLSGSRASDALELVSQFKRILWQLIEEQGDLRQPLATLRSLDDLFDQAAACMVNEYEATQAAQAASTRVGLVQRAQALSLEAENRLTIARLTQEFAAESDPQRLLTVVARGAAQLAGARRAGLAMLDSSGKVLRYQATYYLPRIWSRSLVMPVGEGLAGRAVTTGEPQLAPSLAEIPELAELVRRLGVRSALSLPVAVGGQVIATLDLYDHIGPEPWSADDVSLLRELLPAAGQAVERAQQLLAAHAHARHLSGLNEIAEVLAAHPEPTEALDTVAASMARLLGAKSSSVWLRRGEKWSVRGRYCVAPQPEVEVVAGSLLAAAAADGQTRTIPGGGAEAERWGREAGPAPALIVPIRWSRRVAGLLAVWGRETDFPPDDLALLVAIQRHLANALQQAQLRRRSRRLSQGLQQTLSRMGTGLAAALDLEELAKLITGLAMRFAGADYGALCLRGSHDEPVVRYATPVDSPALAEALAAASRRATLAALAQGLPQWRFPFARGATAENRAALRESRITRMLVLPIAIKGQPAGALIIGCAQESAEPAEDRRLLTYLVEQAAVAIENTELVDTTQRRLVELADLVWMSGEISSTLDVSMIAATAARSSARALDAPMAAMLLAKGDRLEVAAGGIWGIAADAAAAFARGQSGRLAQQVLRRHGPLAVAELDDGETGIRSLACVPLTGKTPMRGVLCVADAVPRRFTAHELALLSAHANQAALALNNALLHEETVMRLGQVSSMFRASQALGDSFDRAELLPALANSACELLGTAACVVRLLDEDTNELVPVAAHGLPADLILPRVKVGEGLLGAVAEQALPLTSGDVGKDGRYAGREGVRRLGLKSLLAVPLVAAGRAIGVLSVLSGESREFSDTDQQLLATLAHSASIALENSRLYHEALERAQLLSQMMDEMSDRVQGSLASTARVLSLSMQDDTGATPPEGAERAISRLQAMAQVYGLLQREGVDAIDLKETCRQIAQAACRKHALPEQRVSWEVAGPRVILPFRAAATVACAINELAANAVRHGCAARPTGRVRIGLTEETRQIVIQVDDDGDGLPADFDLSRDSGLGLQIARDVVEYDLGGEFELVAGAGGATIRLRLPKHAR